MAQWLDSSLLVAPQVGFGTPNTTDGDFNALLCEKPKWTPTNEVQDFDLLTGQIGSAPEKLVGRRSATLTFKIPLEGVSVESTGVEAISDAMAPMWFHLVTAAMGSDYDPVSFADGQVVSATSSAVTITTGQGYNYKAGQLLATALATTSTSPQIGWLKTLGGGEVLNLFEASVNTVNDTDASVFPSNVAWQVNGAITPTFYTFRLQGAANGNKIIMHDAVCDSFKITWESGAVPTIEFTYKCYDFKADNTTAGLVIPDGYYRIPQIVGANNGRATIGGSNACGLESCELTWSATIIENKCHGGTQGMTTPAISKPRIALTFSVPHDSGDAIYDSAGNTTTNGQAKWQSAFELGTRTSIGVYVGSKIGKIFSMLIPSALVQATPSPEDRNGLLAYKVEVRAATYADDASFDGETPDNSPMNSVFRVGIA